MKDKDMKLKHALERYANAQREFLEADHRLTEARAKHTEADYAYKEAQTNLLEAAEVGWERGVNRTFRYGDSVICVDFVAGTVWRTKMEDA